MIKNTTQQTIDNLFNNKNVILVGNSVELMNYEFAEYIDSFDTVVRFGKAIEANELEQKSIGSKLDVWVTGEFRGKMVEIPPFDKLLEGIPVIYNRARIDINKPRKKLESLKNSYDMFSDIELQSLYKKYNIKNGDINSRRLSVGLLMIIFMCEKVKSYKSLTLLGFDFFSKSTSKKRGGTYNPNSWHRPILFAEQEVHDRVQEIQIVSDYESQGLLNWILLSNLNEETIDDTTYGRF